MNLEELIRDAVRAGELTHLSLVPRTVKDENEKPLYHGWGASLSPTSVSGNLFAEDRDPVVALTKVFEDARLYRKAPTKEVKVAAKKKEATSVDLSDIGL